MKTYFHFRLFRDGKPLACGGVTVRASVETFPLGTYVSFTHAVCSWKDNYCKAIGREITDGRAGRGYSQHYGRMYVEKPEYQEVLRLAAEYAEAQSKNLIRVTGAVLALPLRCPVLPYASPLGIDS